MISGLTGYTERRAIPLDRSAGIRALFLSALYWRRVLESGAQRRIESGVQRPVHRRQGVSSSCLNGNGPMLRLCILIRVLLARLEFVNRKRGHNISRDLPR